MVVVWTFRLSNWILDTFTNPLLRPISFSLTSLDIVEKNPTPICSPTLILVDWSTVTFDNTGLSVVFKTLSFQSPPFSADLAPIIVPWKVSGVQSELPKSISRKMI